jgi:hypothetical protein
MRYPLPIAALLLLSGACTSDPFPTVGGNQGGNTGAVQVLLTDSPFPFDQVKRADLYVVRVMAGSDSGINGSLCTGATTIAEPKQRYDLLALQRGTVALLGLSSLPVGSYRDVCITINTDSSSLTLNDGTVLRHDTDPGINWSGSGERIIKVDIFDPIAVVAAGGTFVIHFDVGRSFIPAADVTPAGPDGWFYYVPAVDAVDPGAVGSITGTVVGSAATAGASVPQASIRAMVGNPSMDAGTWFVAATGSTDALGKFKLAFLAPSSRWTGAGWVYIVEAYPPGGSTPQRDTGVTVLPGQETVAETFTMP